MKTPAPSTQSSTQMRESSPAATLLTAASACGLPSASSSVSVTSAGAAEMYKLTLQVLSALSAAGIGHLLRICEVPSPVGWMIVGLVVAVAGLSYAVGYEEGREEVTGD